MIKPFLGVVVAASRSALGEDNEVEQRSSRIIVAPPEVSVVLEESQLEGVPVQVPSASTPFITVEGAGGDRGILQHSQFADACASNIVHRLRCGGEVISVGYGPSGCGKTTALFGSVLEPTSSATASPPSPSLREAQQGLFFDVAERLFALRSTYQVELGISVIEFRPQIRRAGSDEDADDETKESTSADEEEEAVDLIKETVDAITPTLSFAPAAEDIPLSHCVLCSDMSELRTTLLVALSRSQSWIADDGEAVAQSEDSQPRIEVPERSSYHHHHYHRATSRQGNKGSNDLPPPLVPTNGGRSHINVNVFAKFSPLTTPDEVAGLNSNNTTTNNKSTVSTPTIVVSVWRLFDLLGPQLFNFHANAVAESAQQTLCCLMRLVTTPPSQPIREDKRAKCANVVCQWLRRTTAHVMWLCFLRADYPFDMLNADVLRISRSVAERCGRSLSPSQEAIDIRDKHIHVVRRLLESNTTAARTFFLEVLASRGRSQAGSRYALLAHELALEHRSSGTSIRLQSTLSPQSITLDPPPLGPGVVSDTDTQRNGSVSQSAVGGRSLTSMSNDSLTSSGAWQHPRRSASRQQKHSATLSIDAAPAAQRLPEASVKEDIDFASDTHRQCAELVEKLEQSFEKTRKSSLQQQPVETFANDEQPAVEGLSEKRTNTVNNTSLFSNVLARSSSTGGGGAADDEGSTTNFGDGECSLNASTGGGDPPAALGATSAPMLAKKDEALSAAAQQPTQWDDVLRRFRESVTVVEMDEPSMGGSVPRHFDTNPSHHASSHHGSRSTSQDKHHAQTTFGSLSLAASRDVEHANGIRRKQPQPKSQLLNANNNNNSRNVPLGDTDGESSINSALQEEVLHLREEVLSLRNEKRHWEQNKTSQHTSFASSPPEHKDISSLEWAHRLIQPVLQKIEEESADMKSKIFCELQRERESMSALREALHQTSVAGSTRSPHGQDASDGESTYFDDDSYVVGGGKKQKAVPTGFGVLSSESRNNASANNAFDAAMELRRTLHKHRASPLRGATTNSKVNNNNTATSGLNKSSFLNHNRSVMSSGSSVHGGGGGAENTLTHRFNQPSPSDHYSENVQLQRRIRVLEQQVISLHQRNFDLARDLAEASERQILAHRDAFSKILNDSGMMFHKLQRAYGSSKELERQQVSEISHLSAKCCGLEDRVATAESVERKLREALADLQSENARMAQQLKMRNAVVSVSNMFSHASVSSATNSKASEGKRDRDQAEEPLPPSTATFDTWLTDPQSAAADMEINNGSVSGATGTSPDEVLQTSVPDFQKALRGLIRVVGQSVEQSCRSVDMSARALTRISQNSKNDTFASHAASTAALAARELDQQRSRIRVHVDDVLAESAKLECALREAAVRERQYLTAVVNRR